MLSVQDKKKLRALSHQEKALIHVGKFGLTPTVMEAFEDALLRHNLVKVSILKTSDVSLEEVISTLEDAFACDLITKVGRVAVFYRYHKDGRVKL